MRSIYVDKIFRFPFADYKAALKLSSAPKGKARALKVIFQEN